MLKSCNCAETDAWWDSKIDHRTADKGIEKSTFLFPYVFLSIPFVSLVFFHGRSRNRWNLTGRAQIHCLDSHTPSDFVFKHWTSGSNLCCLYFPHSVNIYESSWPFSVVFINEAFDLYEKLSIKCLKTHCIGDQSSDQKHTAKTSWLSVSGFGHDWG